MAYSPVASLARLASWPHRRRWSNRNIRIVEQADGIVVSHTKSGRTWLRVMISHLYHLRYGVSATEIMKFDNFHQLNSNIPKIYYTRDTQTPSFTLSGDAVAYPDDKKVLFLVRDPRDVAVSFYFHVQNRASRRELYRKGIPPETKALSLYEFVTSENLGVPRVIGFMNRWYREMPRFSAVLLMSYESMRAEPEAALKQAIEFLDREFEPDLIQKAAEFASFENLRRKEADGIFETGRLKPANVGERDSFKVRRGKIGGYKDYFEAEQIEYLDALVRETLLSDFGYA